MEPSVKYYLFNSIYFPEKNKTTKLSNSESVSFLSLRSEVFGSSAFYKLQMIAKELDRMRIF